MSLSLVLPCGSGSAIFFDEPASKKSRPSVVRLITSNTHYSVLTQCEKDPFSDSYMGSHLRLFVAAFSVTCRSRSSYTVESFGRKLPMTKHIPFMFSTAAKWYSLAFEYRGTIDTNYRTEKPTYVPPRK